MKVYLVVYHDNTNDQDRVNFDVFSTRQKAQKQFDHQIAEYCQQNDVLAPDYSETDYAVFDDSYGNVYEIFINEEIVQED